MGCAKAPHHLGDVGGNPKQRPLYDYIYVVRYPSIPCPRSHPYTSLALCRQRSMDSKSQALRSESHNDAYIGDRLKATAIAFIILETIFVLLRQWSRHLQKAATGWDDLLIIPSYISCIGLCICAILAVQHGGVGLHIDFVEETAPEKILYWGRSCLIAIPVLYSSAISLSKLAVLSYFLRIFIDKFTRTVCYAIAAITTISCIINIPMFIWQCSPREFAWNPKITGGHCAIPLQTHFRYGTLPHTVTDAIMLILPLPVVWRLKISQRSKIGLSVTFLVGSIALIASVSRSVEFFKTAYFRDATWNAVNLIIWSCVEPGASLIVACLLALPKLLSTILKDGLLSSLPFRSRRTSQYQNFLDQPRDERLLKLRSMSQPKDKHGFALDDDAIALRPWGEAISKAERGEVSKPRPEDKDRIYVQKQISVHSDNRES